MAAMVWKNSMHQNFDLGLGVSSAGMVPDHTR